MTVAISRFARSPQRRQSAAATPIRTIPLTPLLGVLAASGLEVAYLMHAAVLDVFVSRNMGLLIAIVAIVVVSILYHLRAPDSAWQRRLRDGTESFSVFAVICLLGALATYPAAAQTSGFVDASLQRTDLFLRFNWMEWYAFVSVHPTAQFIERVAYETIFVTPALLLGYFAHAGRTADARRLLAAFWLAATITVLSFHFVPAEGPLAYLWHGPIPYLPETALDQARLIPALRAHALRSIDLGNLRGLVAAPSFHAASAVLYTLVAWPVRRIRWPMALINLAMLAATPVEGTHYLTDLIAGIGVGAASFMAITLLARPARGQIDGEGSVNLRVA